MPDGNRRRTALGTFQGGVCGPTRSRPPTVGGLPLYWAYMSKEPDCVRIPVLWYDPQGELADIEAVRDIGQPVRLFTATPISSSHREMTTLSRRNAMSRRPLRRSDPVLVSLHEVELWHPIPRRLSNGSSQCKAAARQPSLAGRVTRSSRFSVVVTALSRSNQEGLPRFVVTRRSLEILEPGSYPVDANRWRATLRGCTIVTFRVGRDEKARSHTGRRTAKPPPGRSENPGVRR